MKSVSDSLDFEIENIIRKIDELRLSVDYWNTDPIEYLNYIQRVQCMIIH